ncbi:MAG: hypothetical protein H5T86_09635, partial [Armatimonadetes bacterium]|nr:hypothetical protein [Armatimonadota bacterium]
GGVQLRSQDLDEYVRADTVWELEFDGQLDLVKAAVQEMGLSGGFEISVRCDAPRGSGLGASASVGVAVVGLLEFLAALSRPDAKRLSPFEIAEVACQLEAKLGIVGGKQDQYAAALGGFNYMEFAGNTVRVEPLTVPEEMVCELEKHLVLCYTGQSRLSGDTNQRMIANYEAGDEVVVQALATVKRIAQDIYHRCFLAEDLTCLPELLNEEWAARSKLAEGVVTEGMERIRRAALAAGALAAKVCGAGGGGCILLYVRPDKEGDVRRAVSAVGGEVLDFVFTQSGLTRWMCQRYASHSANG